ncbi:MAG: PSD1 and planctomycete cytochrome C domain-containing protein [Verrucomicrobiota bacterium]
MQLPCKALIALAGLFLTLSSVQGASPSKVDFNRDIRPIMSDTCFHCHGFDAKSRKGGLRLDSREESLKAGKSGELAVVPGKPEKSEIIKRIFATDEDEVMPPKSAHKDLTPAQKELFRRWVAEGAEYQGHWAFTAPKRPEVPKITGKNSPVQNPIDNFILARLGQEKLQLTSEADRITLIRRLSFDLTGIPPTPAEVDAFLSDKSPNAYEKLVDRLFASPRYGERMAMQWLDYARYADSHGFQTDSSRQMWPWRDWVINAFNENKPFDKFTVEQIAGDLLPAPSLSQVVATGFNRNHRINGEGGIIDEEWRIENIIDRVETTGATWMALTLNCTRCHDHKYDPITQKEFYQFFAFFNNVEETGVIRGASNRSGGNPDPFVKVPSPEQTVQLALLEDKAKAAQAKVTEVQKELPALVAAWEPGFRAKLEAEVSPWIPLQPTDVKSTGGATLTLQPDGSYLASGPNPAKDAYVITAPVTAGQFTGLLLEAFPDASLPEKSLGRNSNGNFVLSKVEAEITAPELSEPIKVSFTKAEADYSQKDWGIESLVPAAEPATKAKAKAKNATASNRGKGWAVDGPTKKEPRKAMLLAYKPVSIPSNGTLTIRLKHEALNNHNIGRFRLSMTAQPTAMVKLDGSSGVPAAIKTAIAQPADQRSAAQRTELEKYFRTNVDNPVKRADAALAAANKAVKDYSDKLPTVMVMKELAKPRDAFVLKRGEYDKKGDQVFPALPAMLPPMPAGAPSNRLGLAKWLVDPSHPLTSRVWVNRQWERFFGTGIVKTSENFGMQSDPPSHPELLDWLATEFVRQGWDMKALQKLIVMSATYRQSSKVTPALLELDPENRLLARGPRFRLPAELIRDQALAASGLLVEKLGGPSVRPYMPEGIWDETSKYGDLRGYKSDKGDGLYRRTLYTIWKRTAAPPTMLMFDSPSREICSVKRARTNTPLQALALLNEVTYVEAARKLAERMLTEGGATPTDRINWAFRRVTSRTPDATDLKILADGLDKRLTRFRTDKEAAAKLISQGESKPDAKLDPAELAAYTLTANVLLNLDEVVTKE